MSSVDRRGFLRGAVALGAGVAIGGFELRLAIDAGATVTSPTIAGCATWGAAAARAAITVLNQRPTKIIVHHTDSANSTDVSQAHAFALARSIQQTHFNNGWIDSGQQFTISRGGYVMEGRHQSLSVLRGGTQQVQGAHCVGQNDVAVGIENEGNYMTVAPPAALYDQLVSMCAYTCQRYGIPAGQIYGHRDFNATDCPGDVLYAKLPELRSDVAGRLGGGTARSWPTVSVGQTSGRVRAVQYLLRARGNPVPVDGVFGSGTQAAVQAFQSAHGLTADGVVRAPTWEALVITVRSGSSGDAVRAAQSRLVVHGYSVTVDGAFGPATDSAMRSFQSASGLPADGVAGLDTWAKLVT
jgi:hypothetical protein